MPGSWRKHIFWLWRGLICAPFCVVKPRRGPLDDVLCCLLEHVTGTVVPYHTQGLHGMGLPHVVQSGIAALRRRTTVLHVGVDLEHVHVQACSMCSCRLLLVCGDGGARATPRRTQITPCGLEMPLPVVRRLEPDDLFQVSQLHIKKQRRCTPANKCNF